MVDPYVVRFVCIVELVDLPVAFIRCTIARDDESETPTGLGLFCALSPFLYLSIEILHYILIILQS